MVWAPRATKKAGPLRGRPWDQTRGKRLQFCRGHRHLDLLDLAGLHNGRVGGHGCRLWRRSRDDRGGGSLSRSGGGRCGRNCNRSWRFNVHDDFYFRTVFNLTPKHTDLRRWYATPLGGHVLRSCCPYSRILCMPFTRIQFPNDLIIKYMINYQLNKFGVR